MDAIIFLIHMTCCIIGLHDLLSKESGREFDEEVYQARKYIRKVWLLNRHQYPDSTGTEG